MIFDNKYYTVRSFVSDEYKTKELNKKGIKPVRYLSAREFKNYSRNNGGIVIGDIKLNQKHYEDVVTSDYPEKVVKKKSKKRITGVVQFELKDLYDNSVELTAFKKFDLYERLCFRRTVGYAYVGGQKFVRLCTFSLIPLIIFVILLLGLLTELLCPVPNEVETTTPPMADQAPYSESVQAQHDPSQNFAIMLKSTYYVSKDYPTIELKNYMKNVKCISYDVYTSDGVFIGSTGLIYPGNSAKVNVYSVLNTPGEYELTMNVKNYNDDGSVNPVDGDIIVDVVVK